MEREIKQGFAWHIYHDELLGWCYDYDGRVRWIKNTKPESERPLRLRLFRLVKGKLPKELVEVWGAYDKVRETFEKYKPQIEALHKKECPDCPWDGKTIFGDKK